MTARAMESRAVSERCPAKVNVGLQVLARRLDGYHEIETLMVPLELHDTLYVELADRPGIELEVRGADLSTADDNLVCRALRLASEALGGEPCYRAALEKRIPVAAGLGGGSSDAAGAIRAAERLAGRALASDVRAGIARRLGADVPFFLEPAPAFARGIGELLSPAVPWPPLWCVLVALPVAVATPEVYAAVSRLLTLPRHPSSIASLLGPPWASTARGTVGPVLAAQPPAASSAGPHSAGHSSEVFPASTASPGVSAAGALGAAGWRAIRPPNDLERVTAQRHPEILELIAKLIAAGAAIAGMSGSGPTVYGLFHGRPAAERAAARLQIPEGARTLLTAAPGA